MQSKVLKALAALTASVVCFSAQAETLRIGSETVYPPFEYLNSQTGKYEGFDIDLIEAMGKKAGFEVKILSMGLDGLIPALLSGTIDAAISAFTVTPERARRVDFTDPYYDSGLAIVVRKEDAALVRGAKDLENKVLCSEIGSDGALYMSRLPGTKVRSFNAVAEAFLELNQKGCFAIVNDKPVNEYFLNSKAGRAMNLVELPMTLTSSQYAIAVKKGNDAMRTRLNAALRALKEDGTYDRLYAKWFGQRQRS